MKKWLTIGGIVFVALVVGLLWLFLAQGWLDEVRDIALIVLVMFQLISTLLIVVLLATLVTAVSELRRLAGESITPKVSEVLDNVKQTTSTAKTTGIYIAEGVVSPFIKLAGALAGVKAGAQALAKRRAKQERAQEVGE